MNKSILMILESLLQMDNSFYDIIASLSGKNEIAREIRRMDSKDVKTNQNYIKTSPDKNDEILSVNDSQVDRIIKAGENPYNKKGNIIKIGRFVKQLLELNGLKFTDAEIEKFVNLYKNSWDAENNPTSQMSIIEGEKIRWAYLQENYTDGGGTLGSSCMKDRQCQKFFDIYVDNPEVCKMVIFSDVDGKVRSRALLWKCTDESKLDYYLDRIYTRYDRDAEMVRNFVSEKYKDFKIGFHGDRISSSPNEVKISPKEYKLYPYVDSFLFYYPSLGILRSVNHEDKDCLCFKLRETNGHAVVIDHVFSKRLNKYIKEKDAVWSSRDEDYFLKEMCVPSIYDTFVLKEDGVYSDLYKCYIHKDDVMNTEWGVSSKKDISRVLTRDGKMVIMPNIFRGTKFIITSGDIAAEIELTFKDIYDRYQLKTNQKNFTKVTKCILKGSIFTHEAYSNGYRDVYTNHENSPIPISFSLRGNHFSLSEDVKLFSLTRYEDSDYFIRKDEVLSILYPTQQFNYDRYVKKLNEIKNSDNTKEVEDKKKYFESIHKTYMSDDRQYRNSYLEKKISSNDPESVKLFNNLYNSKFVEPDYSKLSNVDIGAILRFIESNGMFSLPPKSVNRDELMQLLSTDLKIYILRLRYFYSFSDFDTSWTIRSMRTYEGSNIPVPPIGSISASLLCNEIYEVSEIFYQKRTNPSSDEYIKWNSCQRYIQNHVKESFDDWYNNFYLKK